MTINNYWWLLIWIITGGLLISKIVPMEQITVCGRKVYRYNILSAVSIFFPYFIWTAFRNDTIGDSLLSS